jgi:hypothetical protein
MTLFGLRTLTPHIPLHEHRSLDSQHPGNHSTTFLLACIDTDSPIQKIDNFIYHQPSTPPPTSVLLIARFELRPLQLSSALSSFSFSLRSEARQGLGLIRALQVLFCLLNDLLGKHLRGHLSLSLSNVYKVDVCGFAQSRGAF